MRQQVAQRAPDPDRDYRAFPATRFAAGRVLYRQHHGERGAWWFCGDGSGRFDLAAPDGTCYLALSRPAALRELVGPDLGAAGVIPSSVLAGRVISRLPLPEPVRAANVSSNRASNRFGVTAELATMTPYAIPRQWAAVLHGAGFGGIAVTLRFSAGRSAGLAWFGPAGENTAWPADPEPLDCVTLARRMRLRVVEPPDTDQLTIIEPPAR